MTDTIDFQERFDIKQTGPHSYIGKHPLTKALSSAKGVYGGNIVAQSILVAIRSSPKHFTPNSVHSYFAKVVSGEQPIEWEVDNISDGNNFCGRSIRGLQDGDVKFVATVSLARKNSMKKAEKVYEEYVEKQRQKEEERKKAGAGAEDDDDDDDDDEPVIDKPFQFQTPYPDWLKNADLDAIKTDHRTSSRRIYHKIPEKLVTLKGTEWEDDLPVSDRRLSWFVRLGLGDVKITDPAFQFVALAVLSDSMFSTRLARALRIRNVDLALYAHYFSISVDHAIYFHDTDFDASEWMGFSFKASRYASGRFLIEGQMYNQAQQHVASCVQEGLAHFNGVEKDAKL